MKSDIIKSLAICALGATVLAGCASSPSSTPSSSSASSAASSAASSQQGVKLGKVTSVETVAVVDQTLVGASSGNSAVVTTATGGGPAAVTVQFNDGTEGRYIIERPTMKHTVGDNVYVITDGDRTGIMRRQ